MENFLETGKIVNIHGIRGEVKIMPWSDEPDFLCRFDKLYVGKAREIFTVEYAKVHKNTVIVKLSGIDDPEAANELRNRIVYIDRDDVELAEGTYFIADLIGITVKDADTGAVYGEVRDVFQTGANDVYEIKNGDKLCYAPAIPDVVVNIDLSRREMLIRPLEGLFDED